MKGKKNQSEKQGYRVKGEFKPWVKTLAAFIIITFLTSQIGWAQDYKPMDASAQSNPSDLKTISAQDMAEQTSVINPKIQTRESTTDFLQDTLTLTKDVKEEEVLRQAPDEAKAEDQNYEYERYSFEDAVEQLRPEYAAAVIVKDITKEDLQKLLELDFEVSLVVLHGEFVLFSTGNEEEIGILKPAQELLQKASLIAHTHVGQEAQAGPSLFDLDHAVESPLEEYVLTGEGVFAYNQAGILNKEKPEAYDWFLEKIHKALSSPAGFSLNQHGEVRGPMKPSSSPNDLIGDPETLDSRFRGNDGNVQARADLNEFIQQMDLYNSAPAELKESFRHAAPVLATTSPYFQTTAETGLSTYWNFNSVSGTGTGDQSGNNNNAVMMNGPVASPNVPSKVTGDTGSLTFDGVNDYAYGATQSAAPNLFTVSLWFNSTVGGGQLIGFGQNQTGDNWTLDRQIFMGDWGHLYFAVYSNGIKEIRTPGTYIDGKWHNVAASLSAAGMALYVDGVLLASDSTVTSGMAYQGYWRMGGDNLYNWWNHPYNYYFKGQMDEARIYNRALSAQEIQTLAAGSSLGAVTPTIQTTTLTVNYTADGIAKSKTFSNLVQGDNNLQIIEQDALGNKSILNGKVKVDLSSSAPNPPAVNALPLYTNGTSFTLSGSKPAGTSVWINGIQAVALDNNTTWTFNATLTQETLNNFSISTKDANGIQSSLITQSITWDKTPPTGSLDINSGATSVNTQNVTLTLSAADGGSGMDKMSFSTDNLNWSASEVYAASKSFTLPTGDGNKTVYVKFYDKAGNVSTVYSKSINLNTSGLTPAYQVTLEAENMTKTTGGWSPDGWNIWSNGEIYSSQTLPIAGTYEIQVIAKGEMGAGLWPLMEFRIDNQVIDSAITVNQTNWTTYTFSNLQLAAGSHKFAVGFINDSCCTNGDRNLYADKILIKQITAPVTTVNPPLVNTLPIYTNSASLTLSGTKPANTSIWINGVQQVALNASTSWTYTAPLSANQLYPFSVTTKDSSGNQSTAVNVSTTLDTTAPAGTIKINNDAAYTTSTSFALTLTGADALSGIDQMRFSGDSGATWSVWENYAAAKSLTIPAGDGTKTVQVQLKDKAGNTATFSDTIILDTILPTGSIDINSGAAAVNSQTVTLAITAADGGSGLDKMAFSTDGIAWAWENFAASKTFTLPTGDGNKTISVKFQDKAGNVSAVSSKSIVLDTKAPVLTSTEAYFQSSTETGLGAYWNFENTSGTSVPDQSGKNNTATLINGPITSTSVPSQIAGDTASLSFDGVNDYADIPYSSALNITGEVTVSAWIKMSATGRDEKIVSNQSGTAGGYKLGIYSDNRLEFEIRDSSNNYSLNRWVGGGTALQAGQWYQVTGVYSDSGNYIRTYVNGVLDRELITSGVLGSSTGNVKIGRESFANAFFFAGNMDDFRIYNRALSASEIQTLAQGKSLATAVPVITTNSVTVNYTLDGVAKTKTFSNLTEGDNTLQIVEQDAAGNQTTLTGKVKVQTPSDYTKALADGTQLVVVNRLLNKEKLSDGSEVSYDANQIVTKFRYLNGEEIRYDDSTQKIQITDTVGNITETLDKPQPSPLDETKAVRLNFEGGLSGFYINGQPVEFRTSAGVRVTNFTLSSTGDIVNALLVSPDGTLEVVRKGVVIRRIYPDGTVTDFTPAGFFVREITPSVTQYYRYEKLSQTKFASLEIFTKNGSVSRYDELGILRDVKDGTGKHFVYERQMEGTGYKTFLNTGSSTVPAPETLLEGHYNATGEISRLVLKNNRQIFFASGRISKVLEADGKEANYSYQEEQGILEGLEVNRSGGAYQYDSNGFLKTIQTSAGTLQRIQQDSNGDGKISDADVVQILLETVGGDKLSDFQLDSQGKILNGILTTKDGIKQTIQNGILTGFQTVDGKIYDYQNNQATLKEWNFQDGTKVFFGLPADGSVAGGGTISQILYPDGTRLDTLGLNSQKELVKYTETLPNGTQNFFENGKMVRRITPEKAQIDYDSQGNAVKIILADGTEEVVKYTRDNSGAIQQIEVAGDKDHYIFNSDGTLKQVLQEGVQASIASQTIQKLSTQFGEILNPQFDAGGILSGTIKYVDGSAQVIQNGNLTDATLADGIQIHYANGRIQSIQTNKALYELLYQGDSTNLQNVQLRIHANGETLDYPLVPYLLNPDFFKQEDYLGHQVNVMGDAHIDTAQPKFGTGALQLDGSGDFVQIADGGSPDFQYGSGDFTIDFWFQGTAPTASQQQLWSQYVPGSGTNAIGLFLENGILKAYLEKGGQPWGGLLNSGTTIEAGRWYHVALVRDQNTLKLFLSGQLKASALVSGDAPSGTFSVNFGAMMTGAGMQYFLKGSLDELRISKGIARYTGNFVPPSDIFQKDSYTKLLLHFNNSASDASLTESSRIASILLPRSLEDTLGDRGKIQSETNTGQNIFLAQLVPDTSRDSVYQFGGTYLPAWGTLAVNGGYGQGQIDQSEILNSWRDASSQTADLLDLNGDGLADRIWMQGMAQNYWWVQLNNGQGFDAPVQWSGVDPAFSLGTLASMDGQATRELNSLIDLNGDGRPDRVMQKNDGSKAWYVQFNNGKGFDAVKLWDDNIQPLSLSTLASTFAASVRNDDGGKAIQEVVSELIDMDGDGLPDRIVRPSVPPYDHWFFQKNLGNEGFADAVLWKGVETSADPDPRIGGSLSWYSTAGDYHPINGALVELEIKINGIIANRDARNRRSGSQSFDITQAERNDILTSLNQILSTYSAQRWLSFIQYEIPEIMLQRIDLMRAAYAIAIAESSLLVDMNGDKRPDRIFIGSKDPANPQGVQNWYIQINDGAGFEDAVLWSDHVRALPNASNPKIATSLRVFNGWEGSRNVTANLQDVTGDGLPDRITLGKDDDGSIQNTWWVEKNNGHGFDTAVAWTGIEGQNANETAIGQENTHFYNPSYGVSSPGWIHQVAALEDINGDKIPDRIISRTGSNVWKVQLGTGSGFSATQEMKIQGLQTQANQVSTSLYDYLHVSLKASQAIASSLGLVRVTLSGADSSASQHWDIQNIGTDWQDFYLPLDKTKSNAAQIKIEFIPASPTTAPSPVVDVDNMTFTAFRPPAAKDWLDRMLTEESSLKNINLRKTKTISDLLGLSSSDPLQPPDWKRLLQAETKINFDAVSNQPKQFETLYGSVSQVQNNQVTETTLPDGTKINFSLPDAAHPQTTTQTVSQGGTTQTLQLSYGQVRTVSRPGKSPLQYSYEFDSVGNEITVVLDPDSAITERYLENKLISRTQANGVVTSFEYDDDGDLIHSNVSYKGRVYNTFNYENSGNGNRIIHTQEGVTEEYNATNQIVSHTTQEGYRYAHTYEKAKKLVITTTTQTTLLPGGGSFSVNVPMVTLQDDPLGEMVQRVALTDYSGFEGEKVFYENGLPKEILFQDGTRIVFDRVESDTVSDENGSEHQENKLMDATVFHPDGTITEFRAGKPFKIISAIGREILIALDPSVILSASEGSPTDSSASPQNDILMNSNESAQFHYVQAQKLWSQSVKASWEKYQAPSTLPTQIEYDKDGNLVTRQFAEGVIELYEGGKIQQIVARDGELLIQYQYDAEGNPIRIELGAARRHLESAVLKLQAEVAVEHEKALALVADRQQVLSQTIEGQYIVTRDRLLAIRSQIESQAGEVASIKASGKKAKSLLGDAMNTIQAGLDQVNRALQDLANQRIQALELLSTQVKTLSDQIETQSADAYAKIESENQIARLQILKEEVSPVIYHWYRKILGRDPSSTEYDSIITTLNYNSYQQGSAANSNLPAWLVTLKNNLSASSELTQRTAEVNAIKNSVKNQLNQYLTMSQANQLAFAQSLGISPQELTVISRGEADTLLNWIMGSSLHFGQSAYIALEALLKDAGKNFQRQDLAARLILTDILTGTLTPLEQNDLVISLYAMQRTAKFYGVDITSYKMNYDALKSIYDSVCPVPSAPCSMRLIAHIDGDHYIIITKVTDTQVTYTDPGAGPESALNQVMLAKGDFLQTWVDPKNPSEGFGYIFSPRAPPLPQSVSSPQSLGGDPKFSVLTVSEQQFVRGAFFPLLIPIIMAVVSAIVTAVTAVATAVAAIVAGLVSGIGSILGGFGALASGLFTGSFAAGFQGLMAGVLSGLGQIAGGFVSGFTALHAGLLMAVQGIASSIPYIGPALSSLTATSAFSGALKFGLLGLTLQGSGKLLDAIGISPKISQALLSGGKLAIGMGLLATGNPMGLSFVAGGTSDLLSSYTQLSPILTGALSVAAASAGAFVGGGLGGGTFSTALASFKSTLPFLVKDFAASGLVSLGSSLGMSPKLSGLLSIPVGMAASGFVSGLNGGGLSAGSILNSIKNSVFSNQTLGGLVSIGASIGLETLGAPAMLQNFLPSFLGQLTSGGSQGGAGDIEIGNGILSKIGEGLQKFGRNVVNAVGNVISFGQKVISGIGSVTVQGFKKAVSAFSSIFSRQTQEGIYADETNLRQATVTANGNIWTWQSGTSRIDYNTQTGEAAESFGVGGTANITGLSQDQGGNFYYQKLNYESAVGSSAVINQSYDNGKLIGWSYDIGGASILSVKGPSDSLNQPWMTSDGWIERGDIEIHAPILIDVPDNLDTPQSEAKQITIPFLFNFTVLGGEIVKATANLVSQTTSAGTNVPAAPAEDRDLFVLVNGITNDKHFSSPNYLANLQKDIVSESENKVAKEDIILSPTFFKSIILALADAGFTVKDLLNPANLTPLGFTLNTAFGPLISKMLNGGKDVLSLIQEALDPTVHAALAQDIKGSLESYFAEEGNQNRAREMIGVGYSGGFLPLAEVLVNNRYNADTQTGYNAKSLVGLGGANFKLSELSQALVDKAGFLIDVIEKVQTTTTTVLNNIEDELVKLVNIAKQLTLPGIGDEVAQTTMSFLRQGLFTSGYDYIFNKTKEMIAMLTGAQPIDIRQSNMNVVVNVYGTKDKLATDYKIGNVTLSGYRDEIGGYSTTDRNHPLVNVEIIGATHSDYVHSDVSFDFLNGGGLVGVAAEWTNALLTVDDRAWNRRVADFVADLIAHSKTEDDLNHFMLEDAVQKHGAITQKINGRWVIKLPGWEQRQ